MCKITENILVAHWTHCTVFIKPKVWSSLLINESLFVLTEISITGTSLLFNCLAIT